ncbi:MAG: peroxidase [Bacteroidota bacterium]
MANDAFFSHLHADSDIRDVILKYGKRFEPLSLFTDTLLRGQSDFSVLERETLAAYVSALNSCTYCYNMHHEVAKRFGIDGALIEALLEDIDSAPTSDKLKPVFHYVKKLTQSPSKMVKADAERVFAAGWSEMALTDAICICALFNLYNRLLDGHGIKGNAPIYDSGADHLTKRGYKMGFIPQFLYRMGWMK